MVVRGLDDALRLADESNPEGHFGRVSAFYACLVRFGHFLPDMLFSCIFHVSALACSGVSF